MSNPYDDPFDGPPVGPSPEPTPPLQPTATKGPLTITVDIDYMLGRVVDTDQYGDPIWQGLRAEVVDVLAARIQKDVAKGVRERINSIIDEQATQVIRETIEAGVPKTNTYGEPTGKTVSLRDEIVRVATEAMTKQRGGYNDSKTIVEEVIRKEVTGALTRELSSAVAEAKQQVTKAVTTSAAEVIERTITDLARGR